MVGKATPDRGGSRKPPIEWALGLRLNNRRTRKTQRDGHNSGVKIWSLSSVSSTLSHANPWTTLSNPCNKVRGKYVVKEVLLASFLPVSSFLRLYRCVIVLLHESEDDYTKHREMVESLYPSFHKKGDLGINKNNRSIMRPAITAKVYKALLLNRIQPEIENVLRKNQNSFRRNCLTTSQILKIHRFSEGVRTKKMREHYCS